MPQTKQLLLALSDMMSVSGSESRSLPALRELVLPYFDSCEEMPNGSMLFFKRCGRENAPVLMLEAHFDEIGMLVSGVTDDGFCHIVGVGGLDTRIMLAGEVIIYGDEPVYGVIPVKAPHLQQPGEDKKLPAVNDLLIDTGYTKAQLEQKGVRIGTPVGFKPVPCELLNGKLSGKGFDDKACLAAAILAVSECVDAPCDICLLCSCKEETDGLGAATGGFKVNPDACIVLDVDFAAVPDTPRHTTVKMGDGPCVSLSAVVNRSLTKAIIGCAERNDLKCQRIVEAVRTGTDADVFLAVREGIPAAVVGIPLKNMHTYSEVVSLADVDDTAALIKTFIEDKEGFEKWMNA